MTFASFNSLWELEKYVIANGVAANDVNFIRWGENRWIIAHA